MPTRITAGLLLSMALCISATALADDGHDHGASSAAPAASALPRFAASSDLFELVGVVNGKQITVYLDRFDDNSPVKGATVELEVGGTKVALKEHAEGEFEGQLAQELQPGVTPVTATVVAGNDTDLLAADIDVHAAQPSTAAATRSWKMLAGGGALGVAALGVLTWAGRRLRAGRRAGGAA